MASSLPVARASMRTISPKVATRGSSSISLQASRGDLCSASPRENVFSIFCQDPLHKGKSGIPSPQTQKLRGIEEKTFPMAVGIKDVARIANVSTATVSRVLGPHRRRRSA
jgi:hypothetical protein